MRVKRSEKGVPPTRRQLRAVEEEFGVYLDSPQNVQRCVNQQFGVYDEDEVHVGDICARELYFNIEELRVKIATLCKQEM